MCSILPIIVLLAAGTLTFMALCLGRRGCNDALRNAKEEMPFILLLLAAQGGRAWAERTMVASAPPLRLPEAFRLLGDGVVAMQSWFPGELVNAFSFLYVLLFPLTLVSASLWLLSKESSMFRGYCVSIAIASTLLLMAHGLMLSPRPALDPSSGISPFLYQDPFWGPLSADIISRGQSFPSGHTALLTVAVLSMRGNRRGAGVALIILGLTIVGVLYLGLHWPADVVAGLFLGWFSVLSGRFLLRRWEGKRSNLWKRASQ